MTTDAAAPFHIFLHNSHSLTSVLKCSRRIGSHATSNCASSWYLVRSCQNHRTKWKEKQTRNKQEQQEQTINNRKNNIIIIVGFIALLDAGENVIQETYLGIAAENMSWTILHRLAQNVKITKHNNFLIHVKVKFIILSSIIFSKDWEVMGLTQKLAVVLFVDRAPPQCLQKGGGRGCVNDSALTISGRPREPIM